MVSARGRGEPAGLSTAAVVAAARRVVADAGLGILSVRAVARELGVAPNALYAHVRSRDDLLDLVLDDVLGEVTPPRGEAPPEQRVIAVFLGTYDALVRHRAVVRGYLVRQGSRGPNAVALGEVVDAALRELGVVGERVGEVRRALIVQVIGFAAFATDAPDAQTGGPAGRAGYERALIWQLHGAVADSSSAAL